DGDIIGSVRLEVRRPNRLCAACSEVGVAGCPSFPVVHQERPIQEQATQADTRQAELMFATCLGRVAAGQPRREWRPIDAWSDFVEPHRLAVDSLLAKN